MRPGAASPIGAVREERFAIKARYDTTES